MGSRIRLTYLDYVYKFNMDAEMARFKMPTFPSNRSRGKAFSI